MFWNYSVQTNIMELFFWLHKYWGQNEFICADLLMSFVHWISIDMEMEEREQKINDLVDVIIGNLNNEGQNGHNSKSDIILSQSDQSLENDNDIADSNISLLSHLNTDESVESLPVNQMGGSVAFPKED